MYPIKWEMIESFRKHWQLTVNPFLASYQNALIESTDSWSQPVIEAKQAMTSMIQYNEDMVRSMFTDLFDEKIEIGGRIERFLFHCDVIREDMNTEKVRLHSHSHDKKTILIYLMCRYPELYCSFEYKEFRSVLKAMDGRSIPTPYESDRYFKNMRNFARFLWADPGFSEESKEYFSNQIIELQPVEIAVDFCLSIA
ncbi:MAG TPA: hypothetical protein PKC30_15950 [Saprospiraceae bacterium]|nr:hypothetical protein [Saprospiraceae bacterium]